jgi:hypothetical protein
MVKPVGYGSPPNYTKWKKGQSGNPKGRKKGQLNLKTMIRQELDRRVASGDGKMLSMTEVIARRLVNAVAKGELKWLPLLIQTGDLRSPDVGDQADTPDRLDPSLMAEFLATYHGKGEDE